jgi:amino acid permease
MDAKTIDSFPIIGFNIILFIVLGVFFQFFYYFINWKTELNYRDLSIYPNKREFPFKFFQSLAIFFYCYSGHNGFFNKIAMKKELKKPKIRRKEFRCANILSMVIYFIFSCLGFLSVPTDVVDIVIEKKRFWDKDIIMTISRIILLPFCLFKIIINLDKLRNIVFYNKEKIDDKLKAIFTFIALSITCICASLYQNIVGYITIIGGFFVPISTFLIPQFKLKKYIEKEYKYEFKNCRIKIKIIFVVFLWVLGFVGGIFGIIDIFKGDL